MTAASVIAGAARAIADEPADVKIWLRSRRCVTDGEQRPADRG
jgi:hypothetical protein